MHALAIFLSVILSLLYSVSGYPTTNYPEKDALRYGFQQTHECKSFEKSFLCVRKCLDKNYDIAVSDKNCKCTCYTKKDKAKYKHRDIDATTWVGGAPSTHLPRWYQTTGTNGVEDSTETREDVVTNEDNDNNSTEKTGGTGKTGEPVTKKGYTEETSKEKTGAHTGETGTVHEGETTHAEEGTGTAAGGKTATASEAESEASHGGETTAVAETTAPHE